MVNILFLKGWTNQPTTGAPKKFQQLKKSSSQIQKPSHHLAGRRKIGGSSDEKNGFQEVGGGVKVCESWLRIQISLAACEAIMAISNKKLQKIMTLGYFITQLVPQAGSNRRLLGFFITASFLKLFIGQSTAVDNLDKTVFKWKHAGSSDLPRSPHHSRGLLS